MGTRTVRLVAVSRPRWRRRVSEVQGASLNLRAERAPGLQEVVLQRLLRELAELIARPGGCSRHKGDATQDSGRCGNDAVRDADAAEVLAARQRVLVPRQRGTAIRGGRRSAHHCVAPASASRTRSRQRPPPARRRLPWRAATTSSESMLRADAEWVLGLTMSNESRRSRCRSPQTVDESEEGGDRHRRYRPLHTHCTRRDEATTRSWARGS